MRTLSENRWVRFTIRRAGRLLVSLWVLVTAAFLMIHLVPGTRSAPRSDRPPRPRWSTQRREDLGLNLPLWQQYLHYLQGLFTGDLGTSIVLAACPVLDIIVQRLPATASLAFLAFLVAVVIGVPDRRRWSPSPPIAGAVAASNWASPAAACSSRRSPTSCSGSRSSTSSASQLGCCRSPAARGRESYILPVIALALGPAAVLARIVRVEMLTVLDADYVRTARAKRLPRVAHLLQPRPPQRRHRDPHARRPAS